MGRADHAPRCATCGKTLPAPLADGKPAVFCSPRCRNIDLGRWLSGTYAIPAPDDEPEDSMLHEDDER
jgi:uncharacterized protein